MISNGISRGTFHILGKSRFVVKNTTSDEQMRNYGYMSMLRTEPSGRSLRGTLDPSFSAAIGKQGIWHISIIHVFEVLELKVLVLKVLAFKVWEFWSWKFLFAIWDSKFGKENSVRPQTEITTFKSRQFNEAGMNIERCIMWHIAGTSQFYRMHVHWTIFLIARSSTGVQVLHK